MARFPHEVISSSGRGCGRASPVPLLRLPCPDAFRICSRDGNPPPPSSTPHSPLMTRTEILTRYRRLRQISKEHHQAVLDIIAPGVMLDWAKRLGLTQGRTVVLGSEHDMTIVEDLATYLPRPGRSHPQGSRIKLAGDDLEHVVVVPGGL